jgi:hypothetical protein
LCGIGVTSRIDDTLSPAACSARTADSRPPPGPFTNTMTVRIPKSATFRAAASAAIWAANGVPLREPLKPTEPALDHATTAPCGSVIATIVLLKVAWICATPSGTLRRVRRRRGVAGAGVAPAAAPAPVAGVAVLAVEVGGFAPATPPRAGLCSRFSSAM